MMPHVTIWQKWQNKKNTIWIATIKTDRKSEDRILFSYKDLKQDHIMGLDKNFYLTLQLNIDEYSHLVALK